MKKGVLAILIAVVAVAGIAAVVAMNNNKNDNKTSSSSSSSDSSSTPSMDNGTGNSGDNNAVATDAVSIKDFAFSPANITVKKGTTVTWTNNDSTAHTVTGDNGGPDSETLEQGETYKFTFGQTGTFAYHCNFHSNMTGKVTVTE